MSLLYNILSRFVIAFLVRSNCLLISWLQSPSTVILEPTKSCHYFHFFPIYLPWSGGLILYFECWAWSQLFHSPLSPSTRGSLVPLCFLPLGWCHLHIWDYWHFSQQSWFQLELYPAKHFTWCTVLLLLLLLLLLLSHLSRVRLCVTQ